MPRAMRLSRAGELDGFEQVLVGPDVGLLAEAVDRALAPGGVGVELLERVGGRRDRARASARCNTAPLGGRL